MKKMNLIENYLSETNKHLPENTRQDILSELRSSLEEQVNERASGENRAANLEDEKHVLKTLGHPVKFAASYKPDQYLIGPTLYPAFIYSIKIGFVVSVSIQLVLSLVLLTASNDSFSFGSVISHLIDSAIMVITIITLVFIVLEYSSEKLNWYDNWHPDSLAHGPTHSVNISDMIINLVVEGFLLLWWNNLLVFTSDSEPSQILLTDIWLPLLWPVNLIFGVLFLMHGYLVLRDRWTPWLLKAEIMLGISGLAICTYLLSNRPLIEIPMVENIARWSWVENLTVGIIVVVILVWVGDTIKYVRILRRM